MPATELIITIRPFGPLQRQVGTEQRPESLRRDHRADHVDVHLPAEVVDRQFEHGTGDRDTGIVDQTGQRLAAQHLAYFSCGGQHGSLIGDIEQQRGEVRAKLTLEPVGVALLADAAEDAIAAPDQQFCSGPANAGGRAGDDDGSHGLSPISCRDHVGQRRQCAMPPTLKGAPQVSVLRMKRRANVAARG
ncbi:hypothetical protein ACVWW2_006675 [Bradyrhizobium sp. LM4.3]